MLLTKLSIVDETTNENVEFTFKAEEDGRVIINLPNLSKEAFDKFNEITKILLGSVSNILKDDFGMKAQGEVSDEEQEATNEALEDPQVDAQSIIDDQELAHNGLG